MSQTQSILFMAVSTLLRPLVRILLRNKVPFGAFSELAKKAYVDVAAKEFGVEGKQQTKSRIATITGLTRREVVRLLEMDDEAQTDAALIERFNRAARVVAGWVRDYRFNNATGEPAVLEYDDGDNSFSRLVFTYSGDVPPRAVLDELVSAGVVEKNNNKITLLVDAFVPKNNLDEKIAILGTDVTFLINTIDHNIYSDSEAPYFQRKVYYDNLPTEVIPKLQALVRKQGQKLIENLDQWMACYDRDRNPDVVGSGRVEAGVGVFYFQNELKTGGPNER